MESINSEFETLSYHNVCKFNKFGFCKFRDCCKFKHVNELCQEASCDILQCLKRHPRECRYHQELRGCNFGKLCCFRHSYNTADSKADAAKIQSLSERVSMLQLLFNEKCQEITIVNEKLDKQENLTNKLGAFEVKLEDAVKRCQENGDNMYVLLHSVDDLERAMKLVQVQIGQHAPRQIVCNFCGKLFPTDPALRTHLINEHRF